MSEIQRRMITYCTNIHSGNTWQETFAQLCQHIPTVKQAVSPDQPFPIGLRLSNEAALALEGRNRQQFFHWCRDNNCFVSTINGFPYDQFHEGSIKEKVYQPDWRHPERVEYTLRLAELLNQWIPEGFSGSISTVPVGFKAHIGPGEFGIIQKNITTVLIQLEKLKQKSGKKIILSLEPEPGCMIETTADVLLFFERMGLPDNLRSYLGVCVDCCHQAVMYENPHESIAALSAADIAIGKVQVSSALRIPEFDRQTITLFEEPCYLHQTVIKGADGGQHHYIDLPRAINEHRHLPGDEWRVHFHMPVFIEKWRYREYHLETTQFYIADLLPQLPSDTLLEVETYTWGVLPVELQLPSVTESIIRELHWVKELNKHNATNDCS
jgi:hypothetical protein